MEVTAFGVVNELGVPAMLANYEAQFPFGWAFVLLRLRKNETRLEYLYSSGHRMVSSGLRLRGLDVQSLGGWFEERIHIHFLCAVVRRWRSNRILQNT